MLKTKLSFLFILPLALPLLAQQNATSSAAFIESEQLFNGTATFPEAEGWVNDFESVLREDQETELENMITAFEASTSYEIALVLVENFGQFQDVAEYTAQLGNEWGVGKAESNNGVVFLISVKKRVVRIATGSGLQDRLPDQVCQEIISQQIIPQFKNQDYFGGIKLGLKSIMQKLQSAVVTD